MLVSLANSIAPPGREQRNTQVGFLGFKGGEQLVKRLVDRPLLVGRQVRIPAWITAELLQRLHVGQVVVAESLVGQPGNHIGLERPGAALDDARPVAVRSLAVDHLGALQHGRCVEGGHQFGKGFLNLRAHAIRMLRVWLPVAFLVQRRPRMIGLVARQLGACHPHGWVLLVHPQALRPVGDVCRLPVSHRNAAAGLLCAAACKVIVQRMEPLMRQRASAFRLGHVDHDQIRLVMRRRLAAPARAEADTQLALQAQGFRRDIQNASQIHEGIVGIVEHALPLTATGALLHPVTELNTTEAECFNKLLRRYVLTVSVILADTGLIGGPAHVGLGYVVAVFNRIPERNRRLVFVIQEGSRLLDGLEGL